MHGKSSSVKTDHLRGDSRKKTTNTARKPSKQKVTFDTKHSEDTPVLYASDVTDTHWSRTDRSATRYRTTSKGGPDWKSVVRRITRDAQTGEVLDDWTITPEDRFDPIKLYGRVPTGPRNITTVLYYNRPEDS